MDSKKFLEVDPEARTCDVVAKIINSVPHELIDCIPRMTSLISIGSAAKTNEKGSGAKKPRIEEPVDPTHPDIIAVNNCLKAAGYNIDNSGGVDNFADEFESVPAAGGPLPNLSDALNTPLSIPALAKKVTDSLIELVHIEKNAAEMLLIDVINRLMNCSSENNEIAPKQLSILDSSSLQSSNGTAHGISMQNLVSTPLFLSMIGEETVANFLNANDKKNTVVPSKHIQHPVNINTTTPVCTVCENPSPTMRYGVRACHACSSFFRNGIRLGRHATQRCISGTSMCPPSSFKGSMSCRSCRWHACLRAGMRKRKNSD